MYDVRLSSLHIAAESMAEIAETLLLSAPSEVNHKQVRDMIAQARRIIAQCKPAGHIEEG